MSGLKFYFAKEKRVIFTKYYRYIFIANLGFLFLETKNKKKETLSLY